MYGNQHVLNGPIFCVRSKRSHIDLDIFMAVKTELSREDEDTDSCDEKSDESERSVQADVAVLKVCLYFTPADVNESI